MYVYVYIFIQGVHARYEIFVLICTPLFALQQLRLISKFMLIKGCTILHVRHGFEINARLMTSLASLCVSVASTNHVKTERQGVV